MATTSKTGLPELRVRRSTMPGARRVAARPRPQLRRVAARPRPQLRLTRRCMCVLCAGGRDMGLVHREHHPEARLWRPRGRPCCDDPVPCVDSRPRPLRSRPSWPPISARTPGHLLRAQSVPPPCSVHRGARGAVGCRGPWRRYWCRDGLHGLQVRVRCGG